MSELKITGIGLDDGVVTMQFIRLPDDIRVDGRVAVSSQAQIDLNHPDYREDADLLIAHAQRMLRNVLEDWESSPPVDMTPEDDDDDEMGMGFP